MGFYIHTTPVFTSQINHFLRRTSSVGVTLGRFYPAPEQISFCASDRYGWRALCCWVLLSAVHSSLFMKVIYLERLEGIPTDLIRRFIWISEFVCLEYSGQSQGCSALIQEIICGS